VLSILTLHNKPNYRTTANYATVRFTKCSASSLLSKLTLSIRSTGAFPCMQTHTHTDNKILEYNKTWTGTEGSVEERATNIYKMKQLIFSFGLQCNTLRLVRLQFQRTLLSPHPYHTPCTVGGTFHHRNQCMGVCMAGALYMAHCKVSCHTAHSTTFCNDGGCTTIRMVPATTVQIWLGYMIIFI